MAVSVRAEQRSIHPYEKILRGVAALVFVVVAVLQVEDITGRTATQWMLQYRLGDFRSWGDLWTYLAELRTGIPPLLSFVEVSSYLLTGSVAWELTVFYRSVFVFVFAMPFLFFSRTRAEYALSYFTSIVFLVAAAKIVPENPQVYDLLFPLFFLLFLLFVRSSASVAGPRLRVGCALAGGFALAAFELTRPYVLILLPLLLFHAYRVLKDRPGHVFVAVCVPVLLLSGGWHAKLLFFQQGQVLWSNYGGENAYRSWAPLMGEKPPDSPPEDPYRDKSFRGSGDFRTMALDTAWHSQKDAHLQRAVVDYVFTHPGPAARHLLWQIGVVLEPQTVVFRKYGGVVFEREPPEGITILYAPLVWLSAAWMLAGGLWLGVRCVRERSLAVLGETPAMILIVFGFSLGVTAFAESGEEARFLVSLLPLLACYPRVFPGHRSRRTL